MNSEQTELIKAFINDELQTGLAYELEYKENHQKLYKALKRLLWEIDH